MLRTNGGKIFEAPPGLPISFRVEGEKRIKRSLELIISVVPVFLLSLPTTKPPSGDRGRIICPAPAAAYLVVLLAPNLPITDPSHRILIEKE